MSLPIQQDISGCFGTSVGLTEDELQPYLQRCEEARTEFANELNQSRFSAYAIARREDDLSALASIAEDWRKRFSRIVLFGTGGSSLGARALAVLAKEGGPKLSVHDNLDPDVMASVLVPNKLADTGFLVVSKSGGTGEILAQTLTAIAALRKTLGQTALKNHFLFISEPGDGVLRRLSREIGACILDHDPNIGGRFSVLSLVGLLPALMLGLDADAVRLGARAVLENTLQKSDSSPAIGAALQVILRDKGFGQSVLLAYGDNFSGFTLWYRQLWAESLGKNGQGTTPINALGPVDQHSQLQLYLDGPQDKQFTVLSLAQTGRGPVVDTQLANSLGANYLAGCAIGDLVGAMQTATAETLVGNGRPVRRMTAGTLNEEVLGALFMHFMLETLFAAHLMGVNPFDQPAVEECKVLARQYLRETK